jgi:hypothetical protein
MPARELIAVAIVVTLAVLVFKWGTPHRHRLETPLARNTTLQRNVPLPVIHSPSVPSPANLSWEDALLPAYAQAWRTRTTLPCPKNRYIAVRGSYGRFTNNMLTFVHGVKLALMTNRTLVLPDTSHEYTGLNSVFDIPALAAFNGFCVILTKINTPDVTHIAQTHGTMPSAGAIGTLAEILIESVYRAPATLVDVDAGDMYHFGIPDKQNNISLADLWSLDFAVHLHMQREIQALAIRFRENFLLPGYVCVHLRWLEGMCHRYLHGHAAAEKMCDLTPELVEKLLHEANYTCHGTSGKSCFYLASDHERKQLDVAFTHAGYITLDAYLPRLQFTTPGYINGLTLRYALDINMMIHAGVYLDEPASSLADFLKVVRQHAHRLNILSSRL